MDVNLVLHKECDGEYQKDEISGTIRGTIVGYLLGYIEWQQARIPDGWNNVRFYCLELGCCVGKIFGHVLGIRDETLLG